MLLASVAEIREQLGFDDMTDINFAAMMALDAAEPQLAAILNTDFAAGPFVDTFYVDRPPYMSGPAVATEFRLRKGLVTALTSVIVAYGIDNFTDGSTDVTDLTAKCQLHPDKGMVKNFNYRFSRQYVQISYNSGFPVDPSDSATYLLTAVPNWLQQAAKLSALISLADSPVLSEASIRLDKNSLGLQRTALLSSHLRYAPVSIMPL